MNLPDVDFARIRHCCATQHGGFEELCVSPFRAEVGNPFEVRRIEGRGGDGGVEAFLQSNNSEILGLQSKYFCELTEKQWKQVEASIKQASESHPEPSWRPAFRRFAIAC